MTAGPPPSPIAERAIRLGTRGSALARRQAGLVAERLADLGWRPDLVPIVTTGDRRPPDTAWGEGAFVGALRDALQTGVVDLAVHSAKDVPLDGPPGIAVVAYLDRRDPRDVVALPRAAGETAAETAARDERKGAATDPLTLLPRGARVGTDSPRRRGFLLAARPDLRVVPLHGNVDTRLRRLDAGEVDALVLAAAGLVRLGRADRIDAFLPLELVPPAPGQGALAVEAAVSSGSAAAAASAGLDDASVRLVVEAERRVLARLGGGCRAPIGVAAQLGASDAGEAVVEIIGGVVEADGRDRRIVVRRGPAAAWTEVAAEVAEALVGGRRGREPEGEEDRR